MMSVVSCELFDGEAWAETMENRKKRGVKCYEDYKGYFYCEDRDGNRYQPTKFPE